VDQLPDAVLMSRDDNVAGEGESIGWHFDDADFDEEDGEKMWGAQRVQMPRAPGAVEMDDGLSNNERRREWERNQPRGQKRPRRPTQGQAEATRIDKQDAHAMVAPTLRTVRGNYTCVRCRGPIKAGTRAWDAATARQRTRWHEKCPEKI
jgi:hypothetical protein